MDKFCFLEKNRVGFIFNHLVFNLPIVDSFSGSLLYTLRVATTVVLLWTYLSTEIEVMVHGRGGGYRWKWWWEARWRHSHDWMKVARTPRVGLFICVRVLTTLLGFCLQDALILHVILNATYDSEGERLVAQPNRVWYLRSCFWRWVINTIWDNWKSVYLLLCKYVMYLCPKLYSGILQNS